MSQLNLVNLAQAEIKKEEALKVKGGACSCACPIDYKVQNLMDNAELGMG